MSIALREQVAPFEHPETSGQRESTVDHAGAVRRRKQPRKQTVAAERGPITPVIVLTESATRLWPLSRAMAPDPFVRLEHLGGKSVLGAMLTRLRAEGQMAAPVIACLAEHRFLVLEELERSGAGEACTIITPASSGTLLAAVAAALQVERDHPGAMIAVLYGCCMIDDEPLLAASLDRAAAAAHMDKIVTAGPAGGGRGMLVARAATLVSGATRQQPALVDDARRAIAGARHELGCLRLDEEALAGRTGGPDLAAIATWPGTTEMSGADGWTELGLDALWQSARRDESGNHIDGDVLTSDSTGCCVLSESGLVATLGLRDVVIVNTRDALLVADRNRTGEVAAIVDGLRQSRRQEQESHVRNARPWGFFEALSRGQRFQVKLLQVKPGAKLSLQMHYHRSEHWIVVKGTARVTIDDRQSLVRENESIYISAAQWHRLENVGKVPLEVIEVQIGTYLGEDDIVRADDVYCRTGAETR